jgi:nucleoside-diphosphate-sugar epimerase
VKALVAGGGGFVGSHLCDALLAAGFDVLCVDNLSTGRARNVAHLQGHPRFTFMQHDICQPFDAPADWVFQLASPASPPRYLEHPIETMMVNAVGTQNLLEIARRSRGRFLVASTSEVYGDPEVHPQVESYRGSVSCTGPRSCYDEGKRFAEALTMAYHRAHGLDVRIIRIFNTYGPRLDPGDGRVVSNFLAEVLRGQPLTIFGSGEQTRSFCYVSDLVAGIMAVMQYPAGSGEVFNLGNPLERTMLELVRIIQDVLNVALPTTYHPLPEDDPRRRQPDITKARTILGWEPKVALEDGLRRTADWFRDELAADAVGAGR